MLNSEKLAYLFSQLSRMEDAGLPANRALELIGKHDPLFEKHIPALVKAVNAGRSIAEAGAKSGLFSKSQAAILNAAAASGQLVPIYAGLAEYYGGRAARIKKIKARLLLPIIILITSLLLAPIADLFNGHITPWGYIKQCGGELIIIFSAAYALYKLPDICKLLHVEIAWQRLQLRAPFVKSWQLSRQMNAFLNYLGFMLAAGMAFAEALPLAAATIPNAELRRRFNTPAVAKQLSAGGSVYETLSAVAGMDAAALQIIGGGEQSGKLADGLLRYAKLQAESQALQDDALAEWIPRLIYVLIAAGMAYSIIAGYSERLAQLPV
ncbi:MAG: type II secretion system F family protein [Methylomonas sp.]|jgi:type II secretory pathway component PulF